MYVCHKHNLRTTNAYSNLLFYFDSVADELRKQREKLELKDDSDDDSNENEH